MCQEAENIVENRTGLKDSRVRQETENIVEHRTGLKDSRVCQETENIVEHRTDSRILECVKRQRT